MINYYAFILSLCQVFMSFFLKSFCEKKINERSSITAVIFEKTRGNLVTKRRQGKIPAGGHPKLVLSPRPCSDLMPQTRMFSIDTA